MAACFHFYYDVYMLNLNVQWVVSGRLPGMCNGFPGSLIFIGFLVLPIHTFITYLCLLQNLKGQKLTVAGWLTLVRT